MDDLKRLERTLVNKAEEAHLGVKRAEAELAMLKNFKPPARKNKLVSDAQRCMHLLQGGHPFVEERASGRTTARALHCLSQAMLNPGVSVLCEDHSIWRGATHRKREVARLALHLADKLELKHFEAAMLPSPTLRYTVMEE